MTIKELSKYSKIKNEIKQIEENIKELEETVVNTSKITGMPVSTNSNSSPTERLGIKLAILKEKLHKKTEALIDEAHKIENYIESVQDSDIRLIISKRFLNCKTWEQVGKELFTDRTTPYYKLKNYLKKENLNENKKEDNKLI